MSVKKLDPVKKAALVQQLVKVLQGIDAEDRKSIVHAAQVVLGDPPATGGATKGQSNSGGDGDGSQSAPDMAEFFERDGKQKPADNAYLCAAYHYAQYGTVPFSLQEIKAIAIDAGVTIPDRVDMTLTQAGKKGKRLFAKAGRDLYKPTANAGVFFKENYSVKPGKQAKPVSKEK